ncbi:MAG: histidine phosphatase family protein [Bacteroidales bacterium]|jgi:phosphohistidine phosphatase|nr:histidine phosphatase family protein [Bacteroidales bacterium]
MKYITAIRHAKPEEVASTMSDFDRKLNEKGINDSKLIGNYIKTNLPKVNLIFSSSAQRAIQTANLIAEQINYPIQKITFDDELYDCSASYFFELLLELTPTTHHIIIVGHNSAISEFTNLLINSDFEVLPTCGLNHISIDTFNWEDVDMGSGKLLKRITPKDLK